jgi:heme/copper-type cytochrome/quinol oxidase subunit 3
MITNLSTPGKRKATAFLMTFLMGAVFAFVRLLLPLFTDRMEPISDIPTGCATMISVALGVLFTAQTVAKFSPSVREGKEPA